MQDASRTKLAGNDIMGTLLQGLSHLSTTLDPLWLGYNVAQGGPSLEAISVSSAAMISLLKENHMLRYSQLKNQRLGGHLV